MAILPTPKPETVEVGLKRDRAEREAGAPGAGPAAAGLTGGELDGGPGPGRGSGGGVAVRERRPYSTCQL